MAGWLQNARVALKLGKLELSAYGHNLANKYYTVDSFYDVQPFGYVQGHASHVWSRSPLHLLKTGSVGGRHPEFQARGGVDLWDRPLDGGGRLDAVCREIFGMCLQTQPCPRSPAATARCLPNLDPMVTRHTGCVKPADRSRALRCRTDSCLESPCVPSGEQAGVIRALARQAG